MSWDDELNEHLSDLKGAGLYRRLREVDPLGGMRAHVEGRDCVMFSTNNYLGLADDPEVLDGARRALDRYGAGAQASRLVSGHFPIHRVLEEETAAFKGAEACLAFPAGFMANLAAVSAMAGEGDVVLCDRLNHASLVDAIRASGAKLKVFKHLDMADLERVLERCGDFRRRVIVTDALFSMDGDLAPLPKIMDLAERFRSLVLVDDAHGTGVLGPGGRGAAHHFPLKRPPDVVVGTYSKALGSVGGFVAGSSALKETLVNKARTFIYTTGLPPSSCGASRAALAVLAREPQRVDRLWEISKRLREGLRALGFEVPRGAGPILPVMLGGNEDALRMSEKLFESGFVVPAIRPPTVPKGTARLRLSVSSAHADGDIEGLLGAFKRL